MESYHAVQAEQETLRADERLKNLNEAYLDSSSRILNVLVSKPNAMTLDLLTRTMPVMF